MKYTVHVHSFCIKGSTDHTRTMSGETERSSWRRDMEDHIRITHAFRGWFLDLLSGYTCRWDDLGES